MKIDDYLVYLAHCVDDVDAMRTDEVEAAIHTGADAVITLRSKLATLCVNIAGFAHDAIENDGHDNSRALLALDHMALHHDIELALMVVRWQLVNVLDAVTL